MPNHSPGGLTLEMIVRFVDIDEIDDHHCLSFLFILRYQRTMYVLGIYQTFITPHTYYVVLIACRVRSDSSWWAVERRSRIFGSTWRLCKADSRIRINSYCYHCVRMCSLFDWYPRNMWSLLYC